MLVAAAIRDGTTKLAFSFQAPFLLSAFRIFLSISHTLSVSSSALLLSSRLAYSRFYLSPQLAATRAHLEPGESIQEDDVLPSFPHCNLSANHHGCYEPSQLVGPLALSSAFIRVTFAPFSILGHWILGKTSRKHALCDVLSWKTYRKLDLSERVETSIYPVQLHLCANGSLRLSKPDLANVATVTRRDFYLRFPAEGRESTQWFRTVKSATGPIYSL
jgi:hypothetical protein